VSTPETAATIWELVEARAVASPDAIALIDESDTRISCAELRDEALRTAAGLAEMGVGENTPVTWQLPTTIDAIVISLALARLGALQNPILHIYRERELGVAIRRTRPELVIVPGEWMGTDFAAMAAGVIDSLDGAVPEVLNLADGRPSGDPATLSPFVAPADPATTVRWIYYTSGTTSEPKVAWPQRSTSAPMTLGRWPFPMPTSPGPTT